MTVTEEDIKEMRRVQAFTDAIPAAQARAPKDPMTSFPGDVPEPAPPAPPPPPPPKPFSWNAPGFENAPPSGGAMLGRTGPAAPPPPAPDPAFSDPNASTIPAAPDPLAGAAMRGEVHDPAAPTRENPEGGAPPAPPEGAPMGGGSPGVLIPGGMQPYTAKVDTKVAKGNAPGEEAMADLAGGLEMGANNQGRDAQRVLFEQERAAAQLKLAANDAAMSQHAAVQQSRENIVNDRLAAIEDLNRQAQGQPEDLWSSRSTLGSLMGFLFSTLGAVSIVAGKGSGASLGGGVAAGAGGNFITGLVNKDLAVRAEDRKLAGDAAKRQTDLLHLHLDALKSKDAAIDATKLAYYDNVLQQMDASAESLRRKNMLNEGAYERLQGQTLEERRKVMHSLYTNTVNDVTHEEVSKMRPPQMLGGAARQEDIPHTFTTPDGTTYAVATDVEAAAAKKRIDVLGRYARMNQEILDLRKEANRLGTIGNFTERKTVMARLEDLDTQKGPLLAQMLDGSTLREAEQKQYAKTSTKAISGLGGVTRYLPGQEAERAAADATIKQQIQRAEEDMKGTGQAYNGHIVKKGYVTDPTTGLKRPVAQYTGQDASLPQRLPPPGFKPLDPTLAAPTASRSDREAAPMAPDFGADHPAVAAAKKRSKKK